MNPQIETVKTLTQPTDTSVSSTGVTHRAFLIFYKDPDTALAAARAFISSCKFTIVPFIVLYVNLMLAQGALKTPQTAVEWMRDNTWAFLVGYVIAPIFRAHSAAKIP